MSGLIDQASTPDEAEPPANEVEPDAADATGNAQEIPYHSAAIKAVPPEQQKAFAQLVEAGRKILYSPEMQPEVQQAMSGDKPVWQKLGEGVAKLMGLVDAASKKTAPQALLVPAAIELVADFGEGLKVSEDDLHTATVYVTFCIGKMLGASDDQLKQLAQPGDAATPPAATPAAPPVPEQQGA